MPTIFVSLPQLYLWPLLLLSSTPCHLASLLQHQAAWAIANLALENGDAAIVSAGAIPPLVGMLEIQDKDVQVWASMLG